MKFLPLVYQYITLTTSISRNITNQRLYAGVDSLTRSLAAEWGDFGIRVNGVAPGE